MFSSVCALPSPASAEEQLKTMPVQTARGRFGGDVVEGRPACGEENREASFVLGEDGTMWELSGKVDAAHAGHKVTVNGHVLHRSKTEEAKFADCEKQEAKGKPYADFQVTSLKMVSDYCQ